MKERERERDEKWMRVRVRAEQNKSIIEAQSEWREIIASEICLVIDCR